MDLDTNIDRLFKENKLNEVMVLLDSHIALHPDDARALYLRGKAWWRMGHRARATSDYAKSVAIDPDSPAKLVLENARDIENFFNPDLLNP